MKKRRYVMRLECLGGSTESHFIEGGKLDSPPWVKEGYSFSCGPVAR